MCSKERLQQIKQEQRYWVDKFCKENDFKEEDLPTHCEKCGVPLTTYYESCHLNPDDPKITKWDVNELPWCDECKSSMGPDGTGYTMCDEWGECEGSKCYVYKYCKHDWKV